MESNHSKVLLNNQSYRHYFKVKVAQLYPTLCNFMNYVVHGILQATILEWVAFAFSSGSSQPMDPTLVSHSAGRFFFFFNFFKFLNFYFFLQADSLPTEPQGKPKNTGVGSLLF